MATGFMAWQRVNTAVHCSALLFACLFAASPAQATEVGVVGLFPGKAVLVINGGNPRTLSVGAKADDVKLLSVDQETATLEFDGKRHRLAIGQHAFASAGSGGGEQTVTLAADGRGHFFTTGIVNGATIPFMVDTGATSIALGESHARSANVDLRNAKVIQILTANGVTQARLVTLDSVRIGDVTLLNVQASVAGHDMPYALLGMSFLNRMEMKRDGETMTLRKRY
jgi:aspartyl protease family protein